MRRTVLTILVTCAIGLATPADIRAAEIADGIYPIVPDGQGTTVLRSSGGSVDLGDRVSGDFGDVEVWSLTNQNDRFRVLMKGAAPLNDRLRFAICANGVCEVVSSYSELDTAGKRRLTVTVVGQENAKKVASALNGKIEQRDHPGHQLRANWKSMKASFKVGEPVMLELEIENVGSTTVRFMEGGQQRGARDNQFGFTAFAGEGYGDPIPDTGDPRHHGGIGAFRTLKPGEVFRKDVDVSKWFLFEKADVYEITAMYELELKNEDFDAKVLWDDFAVGRCLVRIEE